MGGLVGMGGGVVLLVGFDTRVILLLHLKDILTVSVLEEVSDFPDLGGGICEGCPFGVMV
jgi:hypothetical protein